MTEADPKSFSLYRGKAPLALQIIAGLMWLGGLLMILSGIPMLLIFGLGIIPIVLGVLNIKYGRAIFRMQKKGYKGAIILQIISLVVLIGSVLAQGFGKLDVSMVISIILYLIVVGVLYSYREKFV